MTACCCCCCWSSKFVSCISNVGPMTSPIRGIVVVVGIAVVGLVVIVVTGGC